MKIIRHQLPSFLLLPLLLGLLALGCDDSSSKPKDKCVNGVQDGDETAVDCGGSCDPCGMGETCLAAADCASGFCDDVQGICTCADGFVEHDEICVDIDECAEDTDNCDVNATCTNTQGSFTCACNEGFTGDGVTCSADLDCATGGAVCDANATCTEQEGGSYCVCDEGFTGDGLTCADLDECATGTHNCHLEATCTNTVGSFTCACEDGYAGDGVTCADIDECATGAANCDVNATCANTPGSFTCECVHGYAGDGVTCADVDECSDGVDNCHANAYCQNTIGGFDCHCIDGYAGDGLTCTDVDECAEGTHNCDANATCTNITGSFTCACDGGFTGDGLTCADINECAEGTHNCDANATCTNTAGSFTCACDGGFTGDGLTCADVNECAEGTDNCAAYATCTNTEGSFTCACYEGYAGDGVTCTDIDECAEGTDDCHADAICNNTSGSFTCVCRYGFLGDGVDCVDEVVLEPVADSYTSSSSTSSNYGTSTQFIVDRTFNYSFLRFDLSSVPRNALYYETILEVVSYTGYAIGGDGTVYVHEAASDAWGETTITWANQPGVVGGSLGSWWQWYNNDINERLNTVNTPELATAVEDAMTDDDLISFRLHSPGYRTNYRSREYGTAAVRPRLRIRMALLASCADILWLYPDSPSGLYTLDPDGHAGPLPAYEAFCDMVTDGGGWTRIVATDSNSHDWGQTTADIVSTYAAADAATGVYDAFRYLLDFEEVLLKKTAGNNNVGDFASYLLVDAVSGRSIMDILQNDCRPATCASNNDTAHDGARVFRPVSENPMGAWTSAYSGVRINGNLQMRNPANVTVLPEYFFLCGVNESSDNDQSVLAFSDADGTTNTWGDSWRWHSQYGALWSFWNGDYHMCPATAHIGNGYAQSWAGYKGYDTTWNSFHQGSYEVYIR